MTLLRRRLALLSRGRATDSGAASAFVVGFAIVLMVAAGLVIDGGTALNARMRVADDAEQAARAGADAIDLETLRDTGVTTLDPALARQRVSAFLTAVGYGPGQYSVTVTGGTVTVTVSDTVATNLLSLIGIDSFPVEATASSTALTGPRS